MIDKLLRVPKEQVLSPFAASLRSVHPTTLTILAFGVGLCAGVAVWQQAYLLGLALWIGNRILDGLDGTVARVHRKQSDLGGYVDIVLDTVVYALIPLGLALGLGTTAAYVSVGILLASFYINGASWMYLAALLEKRRHGASAQGEMTTITMPSGLIEGLETIVLYSLFLIFPSAAVPLFLLMALLILVTVGQRLVWAARNL